MNRVIYIREGESLRCKGDAYDYRNCLGGSGPCIEVNVIFEDLALCMECNKRVDCLAAPMGCKAQVIWHICDGDSAGLYFNPRYLTDGFIRDRIYTRIEDDERKFKLLTGLTFDEVVTKLYGKVS